MQVINFIGEGNNTFSGVTKLRKSTFRAGNATAGTGIVSLPAAATFDATEALMTVYNSANALGVTPDQETIIPIMLRIRNTVTNTAATDFRIVVTMDNIDRYTSGGTTLVGASPFWDTTATFAQRTSKATINFGSVVSTAASSDVVVVASELIRSSIFIAGESSEMWFGAGPTAPNILNAEADQIALTPYPIVIGRGCTMTVHGYGTSQTGGNPAWEVEFFYVEHPPTNQDS